VNISDAIFGDFLYDAAIFVGGESPVNYPRRRIKRSGHKWKKRWGARLKRTRRMIGGSVRGDAGGNGEKL
jgi:aquaglyceroporin related protein